MQFISSDTDIALSFSPIRFHAIPSHSGGRDEDVLNKEDSCLDGSVDGHAKAPQTSANGYSVAQETDTIVKANGQTNVFDRLLTFAWLSVWVISHMWFLHVGSNTLSTDVMGNRDRTCKMTCASNMKNSVMDKYTSEETLTRYERVFNESILNSM